MEGHRIPKKQKKQKLKAGGGGPTPTFASFFPDIYIY